MDLRQRLLQFVVGIDEAFNALGGGTRQETISGTIGRGLQDKAWWAPACRWVVDGFFGDGHCLKQAQLEELRRKSSLS
jgi:hypothetical protein